MSSGLANPTLVWQGAEACFLHGAVDQIELARGQPSGGLWFDEASMVGVESGQHLGGSVGQLRMKVKRVRYLLVNDLGSSLALFQKEPSKKPLEMACLGCCRCGEKLTRAGYCP